MGVIFVIQNSEHVSIQLFIGSPIQIRLIFLLMTFFILGYIAAYILGLKRESDFKNTIRQLKKQNRDSLSENEFMD